MGIFNKLSRPFRSKLDIYHDEQSRNFRTALEELRKKHEFTLWRVSSDVPRTTEERLQAGEKWGRINRLEDLDCERDLPNGNWAFLQVMVMHDGSVSKEVVCGLADSKTIGLHRSSVSYFAANDLLPKELISSMQIDISGMLSKVDWDGPHLISPFRIVEKILSYTHACIEEQRVKSFTKDRV
jgi:hypothetical protein